MAYPLVVRNFVPLVQRGFMLLWMGVVVVVTVTAWRENPPDGSRLWPWVLLLFWAVGIFAVRWAFSTEAGKLVVAHPGHAVVERGRPFRRTRHSLSRVVLRLEDTRDAEGDPYFHLVLDAPGGRLIVAESHRKESLATLKGRIERAVAGR